MTTVIMAAIALSGSLAPAMKPAFEAQTDYGRAMKVAAAEGKPMAVLIGHGNTFAKLMSDASLPPATAQLLRDKYVCVSVDVDTAKGMELARQFQLADGLVISSAGGTYQALRQPGAVSQTDLTKYAAAYADAAATPTTTVTAGAPVVTSTSGYTPAAPYTVYPAGFAPSSGGFAPGGYSVPSYGGCPNGRCPNAR